MLHTATLVTPLSPSNHVTFPDITDTTYRLPLDIPTTRCPRVRAKCVAYTSHKAPGPPVTDGSLFFDTFDANSASFEYRRYPLDRDVKLEDTSYEKTGDEAPRS